MALSGSLTTTPSADDHQSLCATKQNDQTSRTIDLTKEYTVPSVSSGANTGTKSTLAGTFGKKKACKGFKLALPRNINPYLAYPIAAHVFHDVPWTFRINDRSVHIASEVNSYHSR
jgi:hypothetical protein